MPPRLLADTVRNAGGGVVRLHDRDRLAGGDGGLETTGRRDELEERVLAKLDALLALQDEGYRFVRYDELLMVLRGRPLPPRMPRRGQGKPGAPRRWWRRARRKAKRA